MNKNYISFLFSLFILSVLFCKPLKSMQKQSETPGVGQIIDCFAGKNHDFEIKPVCEFLKIIEVHSHDGVSRFFGIKNEDQVKLNLHEFKRYIASCLGATTNRIIQLIGDSRKLGEAGSAFGRKFLSEHCFSQNCLIEYGYTGYMCENEMEVNSFVNEFINQDPSRARRVLANIVGHSHVAVTQWGCKASPHVKNFIVVYNDGGSIEAQCTKFGDDIFISDNILNVAEGDSLICLEGGFQSFRQVVNCLKSGLHVDFVYHLRKPGGEKLFSTAIFLNKVRTAFSLNPMLSGQDVKNIFAEYSKTLEKIWDEKSPEQAALNEFADNGVYLRILSQGSFFDAKK